MTAAPGPQQPDEVLVPVMRPNGRVYRPRKAPEALLLGYDGDVDGVLVVRTHDVERARVLALAELDATYGDSGPWSVLEPRQVWGHRRPDGGEGYWAWDVRTGASGQPAVRFEVAR